MKEQISCDLWSWRLEIHEPQTTTNMFTLRVPKGETRVVPAFPGADSGQWAFYFLLLVAGGWGYTHTCHTAASEEREEQTNKLEEYFHDE